MAHTAANLNAESFWVRVRYKIPDPPSLLSLNGFCGRKAQCFLSTGREPVWPSGKALGWLSRRTLVRSASALLSLLFKNCGLRTLSCDFAHTINETLK